MTVMSKVITKSTIQFDQLITRFDYSSLKILFLITQLGDYILHKHFLFVSYLIPYNP